MLKKTITAIGCLLYFMHLCVAQPATKKIIPVYFDGQKGDSLYAALTDFFTELKKSGDYDFTVRPDAQYQGSGVRLLKSEEAFRKKIKIPVSIKGFGSEGLYIKGTANNLLIAGNSYLAIREALFIYLDKLGFRYFMPGAEWHIIPALNTVYKNIEILTRPDFEFRSIANGHGFGGSTKAEAEFYFWYKANNMGGAFNVWLGHAYDGIVQRNLKVFQEHPEYFAGKIEKGKIPSIPKFNVANASLVQLVIDDALATVEKQEKSGSPLLLVSMEPSDGGGFCDSPECNAIGEASDQAFYLANKVAEALRKKYPGKWVGSLAYNEHMLPTKYQMAPNVFVMITNGFNRTKYTTNELIKLWGKKVKKTGVYEYLSVYEWDNDLPGKVPAANITYLRKSVQQYYNSGARAYGSESVMGWVLKGPGQYVLSKLLWNTKANTDSLVNEFFTRAFAETAPQIRKLYELWWNYDFRVPSDNDLSEWLSIVNNAYQQTRNETIKKRIDQLKVYIHYLVLHSRLAKNKSKENLLTMLDYAWRNFDTPAFPTLPVMVSLPGYSGFGNLGWYAGGASEWKKEKKPYTNDELQEAIRKDIASLKSLPAVKSFPKAQSFVPLGSVTPVDINKKVNETPHTYWGNFGLIEYIIKIGARPGAASFDITSGFSASPNVEKNVSIKVYPLPAYNTDRDNAKPVAEFEQQKANVTETFSLKSLKAGYYVVSVNDIRKMFVLKFSPAIDYSVMMKPDEQLQTTSLAGLNTFYFFVPKGVTNFRVYKSSSLAIYSPKGRALDHQNNKEEIFDVQVQPGEEGIWTIGGQGGALYIEGVPPYLGVLPATMLVPAYLK